MDFARSVVSIIDLGKAASAFLFLLFVLAGGPFSGSLNEAIYKIDHEQLMLSLTNGISPPDRAHLARELAT